MDTTQPITFDNEPVHVACLRVARRAKKQAVCAYLLALNGRRDTKYFDYAHEALYYAIECEAKAFYAQTGSDTQKLSALNWIIEHSNLARWYINKFYAGSGIQ